MASKGNENAVDSHHPDYDDRVDEWAEMRVTARGQTAVKAAGEEYLPMPLGFAKQKDRGRKMYAAYKKRAQVPEFVSPTIAGMAGIICRVDIVVEDLPADMEFIWERATKDGLPLEALHRRIIEEILTTGRYGLLVEAPLAPAEGPAAAVGPNAANPWFAPYPTEAIINWSTDQKFYVLDECGLVRDKFKWVEEKQYRVLELDDTGKYIQTVYKGADLAADVAIEPTARGAERLDEIPFVVIGSRDLSVTPDTPPLMGVARSTIASYQLSADYRHQLFMTGQETLFVFNADAPDAVGAGVVVAIQAKSKEEHPPSAEYISPQGVGIEKHRQAITDERDAAAQAGAKLFDTEAAVQESGEAKKIRYAAQTATLTTISQAAAAGVEKSLRNMGKMMKSNGAEKIVVVPNLEFLATKLTPTEAKALVDMWVAHAISYETLYDNLQAGEIASPERTAEEELQLIDDEMEDDPALTGSLRTGEPASPPPAPVVVPPVNTPPAA